MKILLQCLLFLGCNALVFSAEILAWKTPLTKIDTGGKASPKLVRLEKPPEASPFFGKDDELWNVTSIVPEGEGTEKLEWTVWNATTGRLVAKGSWAALFELQNHYDLNDPPVQCRVKLDAYRVTPDGSPPDATKQPAFSLTCITRSGQSVKVSIAEGDSSISLETETIFGDDPSIIDARILANISLPDCPNLQIDSSSSFANHEPVWYARNFDGKHGIDLFVTMNLVLTDGTPFHELIMRQDGQKIKPFSTLQIHGASGDMAIGDKHRLVWSAVPAYILEALASQQATDLSLELGDAQNQIKNNDSHFRKVKPPAILMPHVYSMVYDISDALKSNGIRISDGDFTGFDPSTCSVYFYSSNAAEIDKFISLFMMFDDEWPSNLTVISRGVGEMRLISQGGMKSSLSSFDTQSKQSRHFEVEPTIGENESIIDLRCFFEEKVGEKIIHSLDTSATLEAGKFLKLFEIGKADGTKEAMEVKVETFRHDR